MIRDRRAGISLLETMIALAVMALIAGTLSVGLGGSVRVLRSSVGVSAAVDQAVARRDLRTWLEQALVHASPGQGDGGLLGESDQMRFSFVSDDGQFWAGEPVIVTVAHDSLGVVTLTTQGSADGKGREAGSVQVLAGPNSMVEIRYFGRLRPDHEMIWLDHWTPEAGLPELIRFSLSTTEANIPPLTVRPGKSLNHSEMSLSSLLPPSLPSRP